MILFCQFASTLERKEDIDYRGKKLFTAFNNVEKLAALQNLINKKSFLSQHP
jgi:hypothetical protein